MSGLLRIGSANVLSSLIDNSFVLRLFEKQKYIYVKDKSIYASNTQLSMYVSNWMSSQILKIINA